MNIEGLRNLIHTEVQRFLDRRGRRTPCIVDGYRGDIHAVKVKRMPSGTLTGWIQIETDQVGNLVAPNIGDPGWLEPHGSDLRATVFVGSNHNDLNPPPQTIAAGERLIKTSFGSTLYFRNDGSILARDKDGGSILLDAGAVTATDKTNSTYVLDGAGGIQLTPSGGTVTVNGNLTVTQGFNVQNIDGVEHPCNVTGDVNLTGTLTATVDVIGDGHSLATHVHQAPAGGDTGPPIG